jgi:hypothetical protein
MEILSQLFYIPPWLTLLSPFGDLLSSPRRRGPLPLHELPAAALFCHPRAGGDRYPYTNSRHQRSSVIPAQAGTATPTRTAGTSALLSSPRRRSSVIPAQAGTATPTRTAGSRRFSVIPAQAGTATPTRTAGSSALLSSPRRRGPLPLHELPAAALLCHPRAGGDRDPYTKFRQQALLCHPRAGGDRYPYTNCRQHRSSVIPAQAGTATPTRIATSSASLSSPRRRGPLPLHEPPAAALLCHPRAGGDPYPYTNC